MNKKKVLFIDNSNEFTGAFKSALNITEKLDNYEFIFCIPKGSRVAPLLAKRGIKQFEIPFLELQKNSSILFYLPMLVANSFKIKKIIKTEDISHIHVNDLYNLSGVLVKILGTGKPLIYHVRLLKSSYLKPIYSLLARIISRFADDIIFVSRAVEKDFGPSAKAHVIYDSMEFPAEVPRQEPSGKEINVTYVSNFSRGKGQDLALQIFRSAYEKDKNLRLHFIGGTLNRVSNVAYYEEIKLQAEDLSSLGLVKFHGHQENVLEALRKADVFLNCSQSESFSYTTLEALHMGVPIVVMDSGGVKELFEDKKGGYLVPLNGVQEAVDHILKLSRDSEARNLLGKEGKSFVQQRFNPENTKKDIAAIYKKYENND